MPTPIFHRQERDGFLETSHGQNWLDGAIDDLIADTLCVAGERVKEPVMILEEKIATKVTDKYNEGLDYDGALGQVLRHVLFGDADMARSALRLLISDSEVREIADELVRPLADKYVESIEEDEE